MQVLIAILSFLQELQGAGRGRELSGVTGVNGLLVGDWIKAHADEVISHNSKHGMQNVKDPQRLDIVVPILPT